MASSATQDSNLDFSMVPIERSKDIASFQNFDSSGDLEAPAELPVFDLLSEDPLPELSDEPAFSIESRFRVPLAAGPRLTADEESEADQNRSDEAKQGFWFEDDVLMCPCPDCRAPMAVRVWLMVADCWHCGTSIELSEEQERQVRQLIEKRQHQRQVPASGPEPTRRSAESRVTETGPSQRPSATPSPARSQRREQPRPQASPSPAAALPSRRRVQATGGAIGARARIRRMATAGSPSIWLTESLKMTPAWLISAVLHFVALLLLAFFTIPGDEQDAVRIVLSTKVSPANKENDFNV